MTKKVSESGPVTRQIVRDEIRLALYSVNERLDGHDQNFIEIKGILNRMEENIDFLVGAYKKFDEEHTILSRRVSDHEDRITELEKGSSEAN